MNKKERRLRKLIRKEVKKVISEDAARINGRSARDLFKEFIEQETRLEFIKDIELVNIRGGFDGFTAFIEFDRLPADALYDIRCTV